MYRSSCECFSMHRCDLISAGHWNKPNRFPGDMTCSFFAPFFHGNRLPGSHCHVTTIKMSLLRIKDLVSLINTLYLGIPCFLSFASFHSRDTNLRPCNYSKMSIPLTSQPLSPLTKPCRTYNRILLQN